MATIDPVIVKIQADISNLKQGLAQAETSLKGLDDGVKRTGGAFGGFGDSLKKVGAALGATFAATQIYSFFKNAVQGAAEAEAGLTRLRSILLTTGGATQVQIAALEKQAEALSKVGFASKENIITTQSQLATFDLQGKTINKLTPAILDYVAAEKGATATTEDYKQMTNGLAQALQGNFAALTRVGFVLDEETKKKIKSGTESERAAAITEVLNSTYKDFNKTLADTPEGRMMKLQQEFKDIQETIGSALLPILSEFMNFINSKVFPILQKGAEQFKKLTQGLMGEGSLGDGFQKAGQLIKDFFMPIIKSVGGVFDKVKQAFIDNKARIMDLLNSFKDIAAWVNKYIVPLFRTTLVNAVKGAGTAMSAAIKVIIPVAQFVVNTVKGLINGIITIINGLIKGYNKVAGVFGKEQIDTIDKIGEKTFSVTRGLVKMGEEADKSGKKLKGVGDVWAGSKDPSSAISEKEKKAQDAAKKKLEKYKDDVKKIYGDINKVIEEANDKAQEALERRNERIADAQERYAERVADAQERYNEQNAEAAERYAEKVATAHERYGEKMFESQKRYDKKVADAKDKHRAEVLAAEKRFNDQVTELTKRAAKEREQAQSKYAETVTKITEQYTTKTLTLEKNYESKVADLRAKSQSKAEEVIAKGQEKLAAIIEKSRERLRSAWESGTAFSLKDLFGKDEKGEGNVIENLRKQLSATKNLQKAAGELAGKGYTQTFIEQIVKAGPTAGLEMVEAIKQLSPEQQSELQNMYMQLEDLNVAGVNQLAASMSTATSFATSELAEMYHATQEAIAQDLATINNDLQENIAVATEQYQTALTEAATIRDAELSEAYKALQENLTQSQKMLDEGLAKANADFIEALTQAKSKLDETLAEALSELLEAQADAKKELDKALEEAAKALNKSRTEAQNNLNKTLEDAQKTLQKALLDAQKDYNKAIDDINNATQKRLDDLLAKLRQVQNAMNALKAGSGAGVVSNAPSFSPIAPAASVVSTNSTPAVSATTNNNVTIVQNDGGGDPVLTANQVVSAIKYGNVIVPTSPTKLATSESGTIGATSIKSSIVRVGGGGGPGGALAL